MFTKTLRIQSGGLVGGGLVPKLVVNMRISALAHGVHGYIPDG